MNKKGSFLDIVWSVIFIFIIAIVWISIGAISKEELLPEFQEEFTGSHTANVTIQTGINFVTHMDYLGITIFLGILMVMLILAAIIPTEPIYASIFGLLIIVLVVIAPILSNVYEEFAESPDIAPTVIADFQMMDYFVDHLPIITMMMCFLMAMILYGRFRSGVG